MLEFSVVAVVVFTRLSAVTFLSTNTEVFVFLI